MSSLYCYSYRRPLKPPTAVKIYLKVFHLHKIDVEQGSQKSVFKCDAVHSIALTQVVNTVMGVCLKGWSNRSSCVPLCVSPQSPVLDESTGGGGGGGVNGIITADCPFFATFSEDVSLAGGEGGGGGRGGGGKRGGDGGFTLSRCPFYFTLSHTASSL